MEPQWHVNAKDAEVLTVLLGSTFFFCVGHYVCTPKVMERFFKSQTEVERMANSYFLAVFLRGLVLGAGACGSRNGWAFRCAFCPLRQDLYLKTLPSAAPSLSCSCRFYGFRRRKQMFKRIIRS